MKDAVDIRIFDLFPFVVQKADLNFLRQLNYARFRGFRGYSIWAGVKYACERGDNATVEYLLQLLATDIYDSSLSTQRTAAVSKSLQKPRYIQ